MRFRLRTVCLTNNRVPSLYRGGTIPRRFLA